MAEVQVTVEIPEGYELADSRMRQLRCGDTFLNRHGEVETWHESWNSSCIFVIVRKAWQWPKWLKARWIAEEAVGRWYAYNEKPVCNEVDCWQRKNGPCVYLHSSLLDFTPPPCDDWRNSLRENPNWKEPE